MIVSLILVNHNGDFFFVEYLRGFETFAETIFNITDSHTHSFEWQQYGLKLHIPEGAVPAAHTECKIDIKVGFAGQFRILDDLQLVSCIYTGCLVPRGHLSTQSRLKLSTVHPFRSVWSNIKPVALLKSD